MNVDEDRLEVVRRQDVPQFVVEVLDDHSQRGAVVGLRIEQLFDRKLTLRLWLVLVVFLKLGRTYTFVPAKKGPLRLSAF